MNFQFIPETHTYLADGISIPSVTRTLDHAGLVSYDEVRSAVLERKSEIGTLVHLATHYYDEGQLDWSSLDDKTKGRTEAWASFRSDTGFVPRRIEQRFLAGVNGMNFGLTVDREGIFNKQEAVIDIKTSSTIQPWCAIQLAGYAMGVPDYDGYVTSPTSLFLRRRRLVVQLLPNGTYKKRDFTDRSDMEVFISALRITYWKLKSGTQIKELAA